MAGGKLSFLAPPQPLMIHWFSPFGYRFSAPAEMLEYTGDHLSGRFVDSGSPSYFEQERDFMVTIPLEHTMYHQGGRVIAFDPTTLVFRTSLDPRIRRTQQRKSPRVNVDLPPTHGRLLTTKPNRSPVLDLQVKDLSSGGIRMESETSLNQGDVFVVDLTLDEVTIGVTVFVTSCAEVGKEMGRYRIHGRFDRIGQTELETIQQFVRNKLATTVDRRYTVRTPVDWPTAAFAYNGEAETGNRFKIIVTNVSDMGMRFVSLSEVRRGLDFVVDMPGWTGRKESVTDAVDRKIRDVATIDGYQTEVRLRGLIIATPQPAPEYGEDAQRCAAAFYRTDESIRHEMLEFFLR